MSSERRAPCTSGTRWWARREAGARRSWWCPPRFPTSWRIEPLAGYRHSGNEHAFQGARASKDSSPMKIAIVEDERLFRDVLRKACTMHLGHEVAGEAGSGREALLVVPAALPDLLVLDIHLPDMDGLDVLRFLRRKRA